MKVLPMDRFNLHCIEFYSVFFGSRQLPNVENNWFKMRALKYVLWNHLGPHKYTQLLCQLYEQENKDFPVATIDKEAKCKRPFTFCFEDLKPETCYVAIINGICKFDVIHRTATFRTMPEIITRFRYVPLFLYRVELPHPFYASVFRIALHFRSI